MKKILFYLGNEALAFSDIYLVPSYSDIKSRFGKEINTETSIAIGAPKINIPLISSGMDTVTEDAMAEILALNGGIGEIHRNNTADEQSDMVRKVKEKMRLMDENPPMISEKAKISDALKLLGKRKRGYVMVFKGDSFNGEIAGIATDKDFLAGSNDTLIAQVMTPLESDGRRKLVTGDKSTTLKQAVKIMERERVEKLPLIDGNGKLTGVYTYYDYQYIKNYPNAATDNKGKLLVGAAIGVKEMDVERAVKLTEAGVDVIFLDIAHGHSIHTKNMLKRLKVKEKIKIPIIAGNVATGEGVIFAYENGADGVKIGIGPGFVCKTRNVAGTGIPQVTAVMEAKEVLKNKRNAPPIISDGGVRESGDIPKALACGADSVMIGSIFAGTDKSPGDFIRINGVLQKRVRGMASRGVVEDRIKLGDSTTNIKVYAPEGRETFTAYQGLTQEFLNEYIGGLRSAMSYAGAHNIKELQSSQLIRVSGHGGNEQGRPLASI